MTTRARLLLLAPLGALVMTAAGTAQAATPTYYADLPTFQGDLATTVTDDYTDPGYVFIQDDAVMSAVVGETDYSSTGFTNLNIVSGETYCAGCNGSFQLSFQTTSVGTVAGVVGVGLDITTHNMMVPYFAVITFADGTTEEVALPVAGSFWGVAAPERIESIHFGLSMAGTTTSGSFGIDNLVVGDGSPPDSDCCSPSPTGTPGCTDAACEAAVCAVDAFCCDNEWDGICADESAVECPGLCGPVCGDGVVEGAEACDDGGESATCNADCTAAACGDSIVNMTAGEACDDGGESVACDSDCTAAACGDSVVNMTAGENCDDGGRSATCNVDCTAVSCGDGVVNVTAGEQCDDSGESASCDDDCTNAMCGDGVLNATAGESCDDAGESPACNADCTASVCGDGVLNPSAAEACDDGNTDDGDGCAADCTEESDSGTTGDSGDSTSGGMESDEGAADGTTAGADGTTGGGTGGSMGGEGGDDLPPGGDVVGDVVGDDFGDDDGTDTGGSSGGSGGGRGLGSEGCGCTTDADKPRRTAWSLLTLLGFALVRRRRPHLG